MQHLLTSYSLLYTCHGFNYNIAHGLNHEVFTFNNNHVGLNFNMMILLLVSRTLLKDVT